MTVSRTLSLTSIIGLAVGLSLLVAPASAQATKQQSSAQADSVMSADELGREWIEKMSRAMQDETYVGTFVYLHEGDVETMKIYHSKIDGVEHERLISLNGEAREIIRDAESVVCIWPGSKSVIVSKSQPRTPFPQFEPRQLAVLQEHYKFRKSGNARVAGRQTKVVDIQPLDDFRYGYRLWIDIETYLLIRSAMSDSNGQLVEQVLFTNIAFPDMVPLEMFSASVSGRRHEWMVDDEPLLKPIEPIVDTDIPGVDEMALPGGFFLVSDNITPVAGSSHAARRLMYSDGLASLSVFISNTQNSAEGGALHGATSMGAVNAFGVQHDEWHATVVGEVPHSTVEMLARSMLIAPR